MGADEEETTSDVEQWTLARDECTWVHVRSWGVGVRDGMLFGILGGFGVGAALVGLAWAVVAGG